MANGCSFENASAVPEMVTIRTAAQRTGLSYDFLRRACLRGEIVHVRCGAKFFVNFGRLVDWLNTSTGAPEVRNDG